VAKFVKKKKVAKFVKIKVAKWAELREVCVFLILFISLQELLFNTLKIRKCLQQQLSDARF